MRAVGGITQVYTHPNGNDYKSHKFTSNGTFTVTSGSGDVDVLLVGDGGGMVDPTVVVEVLEDLRFFKTFQS